MNISRRVFLSGSASLIVTAPMFSNGFASGAQKKNLVVVMLRGGMDGLTAVPFIGNNILAKARPDIGVDKPIKITPDFALHPRLKKFKKLWDNDKASIFHATSIPYTGRSHFEGQYLMESGGIKPYYDKTGWLGRALEGAGRKSLSVSLPMPLILRGGQNLDNFMPSRNSLPTDETLKILEESLKENNFKILIHCFTGSKDFANELLKLGSYISASGIVGFKMNIDGSNNNNYPPNISAEYSLKNGSLALNAGSNILTELNFIGKFKTGTKGNLGQAKIDVENLKANLPKGNLEATFTINNLINPTISGNVNRTK